MLGRGVRLAVGPRTASRPTIDLTSSCRKWGWKDYRETVAPAVTQTAGGSDSSPRARRALSARPQEIIRCRLLVRIFVGPLSDRGYSIGDALPGATNVITPETGVWKVAVYPSTRARRPTRHGRCDRACARARSTRPHA